MFSRRHLKIILSLLLIGYVARSVDFAKLAQVISGIPLWTVLVLCGGYFIGQLLSSIKWWMLARSCHIEATFVEAFRIYFAAMFVNLAGVGTVGGDVLRGVLIGTARSKRAVGVASVVADRLHGLAVLAGVGTVSVGLFSHGTLPSYLSLMLCGLGGSIILGWFLVPRVVAVILPQQSRFHSKAAEIARAFPTHPRTIASITGISLLFHLTQIALHLCMAYGLGIEVSMTTLMTIVPFVNIVSSLPISWQGLGVRENAYRFFFVPAICSTEQAVAFGALWLLAVTTSALIGGVIGVISGALSRVDEAERSQAVTGPS
jgi:uncharacterized membrane protein YbhN (UPF0104 family)